MTDGNDPHALVETATASYQRGEYEEAASLFGEAAAALEKAGNSLDAAENKNNQSVAYLQAKQPQQALDVLAGTVELFAQADDLHRQGLALGNEAAALDALGHLEQAIEKYQQSADALGQAGEGELRATVLKSLATLQVKRQKYADGLIAMTTSLDSLKKPTFFQKILRTLLRIRI